MNVTANISANISTLQKRSTLGKRPPARCWALRALVPQVGFIVPQVGFIVPLLGFIICLALPANAATAQATETFWYDSLDEAKVAAAKENKVIMLHFWASWCRPCKNLDKFVFKNPEVARSLRQDVIAVKVNIDHRPDLAKKYQVTSIPFEVVINSDELQLGKRSSPNTVDAYMQMVRSFSNLLTPDTLAIAKQMQKLQKDRLDTAQVDATNNILKARGELESEWSKKMAETSNAISGDGKFAYGGQLNLDSQGTAKVAEPNLYIDDIIKRATGSAADKIASGITDPRSNLANAAKQAEKQFKSEVTEAKNTMAAVQNRFANGSNGNGSNGNGGTTLAIEGYCPVTLINQEQWEKGDVRWGCTHRGKTYLFTSKLNRDSFRMAPDAYSPLLAGFDPVMFEEKGKLIEGLRENGAFFGGNDGPKIVVLFKDMQSRTKFEAEPAKYIQIVRQAMNHTDRNTIIR